MAGKILDRIYPKEVFKNFLEDKKKLGSNYLTVEVTTKDSVPLFRIKGDNFFVISINVTNEQQEIGHARPTRYEPRTYLLVS